MITGVFLGADGETVYVELDRGDAGLIEIHPEEEWQVDVETIPRTARRLGP